VLDKLKALITKLLVLALLELVNILFHYVAATTQVVSVVLIVE
jgi:hypothetical protein